MPPRKFDETSAIPASTAPANNPESSWVASVKVPLSWAAVSGLLTGVFAMLMLYCINDYWARLFMTSLLMGLAAAVLAALGDTPRNLTIVIGLVAALVVGLFIIFMPPWAAAITSAVATMLIDWFVKKERVALPALERLTGVDWNGNGVIDEIPPEPAIHVDIADDREGLLSYPRLPIPRKYLIQVCEGFLNGGEDQTGDLGWRTWTGTMKPFSDDGFKNLLRELDTHKLTQVKNGKGELTLSERGRQMFERMLTNARAGYYKEVEQIYYRYTR